MLSQATAAYQKTTQTTADPREVEASVLLKAAAMLQAAQDQWSEDRKQLNETLTYNRRLWTHFMSSVTREENPLPTDVKQNVASLAAFIFKHTFSIQANPAPEKLSILISINRSVAEGLRGNTA